MQVLVDVPARRTAPPRETLAEQPVFCDDDTLELVLTPAQVHVLERAAAAAGVDDSQPDQSAAQALVLAQPVVNASGLAASRGRHCNSMLVPAVALPILGIAAIIQLTAHGFADVAREQTAAAAAGSTPAPSAAPAPLQTVNVGPPPSTAPPVRVVNPFDRSEVFEFPTGTTQTEAHDAVAGILLDRARQRTGR